MGGMANCGHQYEFLYENGTPRYTSIVCQFDSENDHSSVHGLYFVSVSRKFQSHLRSLELEDGGYGGSPGHTIGPTILPLMGKPRQPCM